nr:23S rRNA (guanosine(2251)-2'-O)-methyltransferase RlmB [Ruminiclostridium cellobioparum]
MAGERRSGNGMRGDRKGSFNDRRSPRFEADKRGSFGDKRTSKTDKFDGSRKGPRQEKKSGGTAPEKRMPREPKLDAEVQEEQLGDNDKLEGRNSILEALRANRTINKLFVIKGEREGSIRQIVAMAREKGIIVTEVEKSALDSMSSSRSHQGVIAFVAVKEYVEVDDILQLAQEKGQPPFIIILDEIADPHNFGAILRTANAVGAHGVIIPKRRAIGLTSAVSKAAAGAVEYVPVSRVTNIAQTIEYLKKNNVWVVGTDATGEKAFYESDLKGPLALVVGSEGEGMGKLIREKCDFVVNIPMQGEISSLNASVAAAIVMYEILKQRGRS